MSLNRALTYLKSEIRSRGRENGVVSAADVSNVMRLHFEGAGFLRRTERTEINQNPRHQVTVYRVR